jgi:hypothetical protein
MGHGDYWRYFGRCRLAGRAASGAAGSTDHGSWPNDSAAQFLLGEARVSTPAKTSSTLRFSATSVAAPRPRGDARRVAADLEGGTDDPSKIVAGSAANEDLATWPPYGVRLYRNDPNNSLWLWSFFVNDHQFVIIETLIRIK